MGNRVRVRLSFLRQIKLGIEYGWGILDIDVLCFNLTIDVNNSKMTFFKFYNLFKDKNY